MSFGKNLLCLRQLNNMTQEEMAEKVSVSRQTISKWEMDNAYPEIPKLIEISELFHCKLDDLLTGDIEKKHEDYSEVSLKHFEAFKMARYVMITPNPEDDVNAYMKKWAVKNGLFDIPNYEPKCIGWDFPFISQEQQNRFGLRGYVSAYILPNGFEPEFPGAEIASQDEADYACITIRDPFDRPFEKIPGAYKRVLEYLNANGFKENHENKYLGCFEYVYEEDGTCFMEVCLHADAVNKANIFKSIR